MKSITAPHEFDYNRVMNIPNELMYGINSYRGISSNQKIELSEKLYERYIEQRVVQTQYEAINIAGIIQKNSELNCEIYGNTKPSGFDLYVHKDATINDNLIYGNIIDKSNYTNDYAKLKFNFTGHVLKGKIYGSANLVIQNGFIKNLVVEGRLGGNKFYKCDVRSSSARFSGNIKNLVKSLVLKGTRLKEKSKKLKSKFIEISKTFDDSDINSIKIHRKNKA